MFLLQNLNDNIQNNNKKSTNNKNLSTSFRSNSFIDFYDSKLDNLIIQNNEIEKTEQHKFQNIINNKNFHPSPPPPSLSQRPMTDSVLSFNTSILSSSPNLSHKNNNNVISSNSPVTSNSKLKYRVSNSVSSSPAPSIIKIINNSNSEYLKEKSKRLQKKTAIDMISEEKLHTSNLLDNPRLTSSLFFNTNTNNSMKYNTISFRSFDNLVSKSSENLLINNNSKENTENQNYFDLPESFFSHNSNNKNTINDNSLDKDNLNRSDYLDYGKIVEYNYQTNKITTNYDHEASSSPKEVVKVNLAPSLKTNHKTLKSSPAPAPPTSSPPPPPPPRPQPPLRPLSLLKKQNNETKQQESNTKQQQRSSSSTSFHRVLNRIVEHGIHVTKSKMPHGIVDSSSVTSSANSKNQKFEPIIGYGDEQQPPVKLTTPSTISKGLNKLKFYKKTYSISNSLPSRNFNLKSLIEKLNNHHSSGNGSNSHNSKKLSQLPKTSRDTTKESQMNSSVIYLEPPEVVKQENKPLNTKEKKMKPQAPVLIIKKTEQQLNNSSSTTHVPSSEKSNTTMSINRYKSFSIYNNSSSTGITHLFNNNSQDSLQNKIKKPSGSIIKLKTSKSFNFIAENNNTTKKTEQQIADSSPKVNSEISGSSSTGFFTIKDDPNHDHRLPLKLSTFRSEIPIDNQIDSSEEKKETEKPEEITQEEQELLIQQSFLKKQEENSLEDEELRSKSIDIINLECLMTSTSSSSSPLLSDHNQQQQQEQQQQLHSPKKGALKKLGLRDSSITRSALKVRWNDMIEITNVIEINADNINNNNNFKLDDENFEEQDDPDDIYNEEDLLNGDEEDGDDDLSDDDDLNDGLYGYSDDEEDEYQENDEDIENNNIELKEKMLSSKIIEQFHLKPLHSVGKEFEKEMTQRIEKLNQIKIKSKIDECNEKFFDEIHSDLDTVLYELHSTIEHVRLSSMISNIKQPECNDVISENMLNENKAKMSEIVANCREFVNNSKTMISSALINENEVKMYVREAMNSISSLVVHCFENSFMYLYKNEKLDEIRQLLIQLLNLLNTFRVTLNITYLASSKQINDTNITLLMKQATDLANEIGILIKHFKLLI